MNEMMKKISQFDIAVKNKKDLETILKDEYMNQKLKINLNNFLNAPKVIGVSSIDLDRKQKDLGRLNDTLIELSGSSLIPPKGGIEEDLDLLLSRGQLWVSQAVKKMIGRQSKCHSNSAEIYDANKQEFPTLHLATGYAMSEDGTWRQHTWLLLKKPKSTTIVETTKPKRLAYYGVILTDEEANKFVCNNFSY